MGIVRGQVDHHAIDRPLIARVDQLAPLPLLEALDTRRRANPIATIEKPSATPPEILAEMRERAERAASGLHDPEDTRRACERMDRMREEMRQRFGETDIAVALIREARDQE